MAEHARDRIEPPRDRIGLGKIEPAVGDQIAAIGAIRRIRFHAERRTLPQRRQHRCPGEGENFDRNPDSGLAQRATRFDPSAITIIRREAAATIFSRSIAPPAPLIAPHRESIASAPSIVRSTAATSAKSITTMPQALASSSDAVEVATARIIKPAATRSPNARIAHAAVVPVPRPTSIPVRTSPIAASAAACLSASVDGSVIMYLFRAVWICRSGCCMALRTCTIPVSSDNR